MGTNSEIILAMAIKVVLCALAIIGAVFAAPSGAKKLSVASGSSAGRRLLYDPKPISISPAFGLMEGNTLVTVTHDSQADWGSAAQIRCSFGGATSVATALSPTTISCRTPRQATCFILASGLLVHRSHCCKLRIFPKHARFRFQNQ